MVVFFFQAEDGIRDWSVTGVQTCALPICLRRLRDAGILRGERARRFDVEARVALGGLDELSVRERLTGALEKVRSEERRVGKECRCRWWPDHETKKRRVA